MEHVAVQGVIVGSAGTQQVQQAVHIHTARKVSSHAHRTGNLRTCFSFSSLFDFPEPALAGVPPTFMRMSGSCKVGGVCKQVFLCATPFPNQTLKGVVLIPFPSLPSLCLSLLATALTDTLLGLMRRYVALTQYSSEGGWYWTGTCRAVGQGASKDARRGQRRTGTGKAGRGAKTVCDAGQSFCSKATCLMCPLPADIIRRSFSERLERQSPGTVVWVPLAGPSEAAVCQLLLCSCWL